MESRFSRTSEALRIRRRRISYLATFICAAGCGAPGEPVPPTPPVPVAIKDLTAQQAGDAVQLVFTMPIKTVSGERLAETPAIEVLRGSLKIDGTPDPKSFRSVETIPGALAGDYRIADKTQLTRPLSADGL